MRENKRYVLLTFVLSVVLIAIVYNDAFFKPNSFLFNAYGDGIKNYYTCAHHVKNDKSWFQFGGMKYPYGEHVTYTDGQPLLSIGIKLISKIAPAISDYTIGIMNFSMLISIAICAVFVFLIFVEYGVSKSYAVFAAIAIAFLSPQILRYTAHYALSNSFAIPGIWYLLILLKRTNYYWKIYSIIVIYNICFYLIHPYLGITITLFIVIDTGLSVIKIFREKKYSRIFSQLILMVLPLLFFKVFMFITDHHSGRPENPLGLFHYTSNLEGVFLPFISIFQPFINHFLNSIGIELRSVSDEGHAYVGLITSFIFLLALVTFSNWLRLKIVNRPIPDFYKQFDFSMFKYLFIGLCFLLLSFAVPFKLGTDLIFKIFPAFKQFRGLGRFAWVFYYTSTVFSVYFTWKFYIYFVKQKQREYFVSYFLLAIVPSTYFFESLALHNEVKNGIGKSNLFDRNQLNDDYFDGISLLNKYEYQAILPLPFYEVGSETYVREPKSLGTLLVSQLFSYHANLPIIGGATSRTCLHEAINSIQLLAPGFYEKIILSQFPDKQSKILITYSKDYELTEIERNIFNQGKLLFDCPAYSLLEITTHQLGYNTSELERDKFIEIKSSLINKGDFLVSNNEFPVYFNGFEDKKSDKSYFGNGAFKAPKKDFNVLSQFSSNTFKSDQEYLVSFWMYCKGENVPHTFVCAEEFNPTTQKGSWDNYTDGRFAEVYNGDWSLVELPFKLTDSNSEVKIFIKGEDYYSDSIIIDNLLIRKKGVNVYREFSLVNGATVLFMNNHLIK